MRRKISLVSFILFFVSASSWANGFYLGGGIGSDVADFDQNARVIVQPPGSFFVTADVKDTTHLSGTGIFGTVFGGYGWCYQNFYIAGEVNANLSSVEFKSSNKEFVHGSFSNTSYKIRNNFGLSVLPGYSITPNTLLYVRLGYANGNFKISTTDTSLANISTHLSGCRYGIGVEHSFTPQLSARMEYSHINYQNTKFTVVDMAATKTTKISPNTNQVEFSLIYSFI